MAYASSDIRFAPEETARYSGSGFATLLVRAVVDPLRKRWVYQQTLFDLQGYTERNLLDIGAAHGVPEFARRAAGL